ncbi:MAG: hypothetical protein GX895_04075 [Clostridiales bacterium]|uniref:hypothetical protein n=1 Tax=Clostridium sp. N3C TaxID=1776758 RepID=UPI00092DF5A1|nr:hypothetical protein [Clostridium sp. N3C]NLZ47958.1 hypothetical protein [Clostridiales bacterium]SCN22433.1 hypothetical protein N3C_0785 [Clostridium sp. N3C]
MLSFMDSVYCRIRREEAEKLRRFIRRLKVLKFYESLTKGCWEFGVQEKIITKNNDILEVKLSRGEKELLIRFHKCFKVLVEDYENFINTLQENDIHRGIYITTGEFHKDIISNYYRLTGANNKVTLEDGISFGRKQIGWRGKARDILVYKKFKLARYLP